MFAVEQFFLGMMCLPFAMGIRIDLTTRTIADTAHARYQKARGTPFKDLDRAELMGCTAAKPLVSLHPTYHHEASQSSLPYEISPEMNPVLLVPGYRGKLCDFENMEQWFKEDKFTVYIVNYSSGKTANGSIKEYAKVLGEAVDIVVRQTGAKTVDIIAHSMGGLVSRWYIEKLDGSEKVGRLIMVGTPNHGTELFELGHIPVIGRMLWFLYGAGQADDEITPHSDFLNELGYEGRPNYFTIAGTVPRGPLVIPAITKRVLSGNNDGSVTTMSVRLGEPSKHFEYALDHSELIKNRVLYETMIRKILTDQPIVYEPLPEEVRENDVQKQDVCTQRAPSFANGNGNRRRLLHLIPNLLVNLARVRTPPDFSQNRAVI